MKYFTKIIANLFLCMTLLGFLHSRNLHADVALVIPLYTYHVQHTGNTDYNEHFGNPAIGIQLDKQVFSVSATYVHKNSFKKKSLYLNGLLMNRNRMFKYGAGVLFAVGGYNQSVVPAVVTSLQYGVIRVMTTLPFGKLINNKMDLINVQLILPF